MRRYITLGDGRKVTLGSYVRVVRKAKAHPDATFTRDLRDRWPSTGAAILRQFRTGMHERINAGVPYFRRGGQ